MVRQKCSGIRRSYLVTLTMGRHNVFIRHQKEPGSENKGHGQRWDAYRRQQCVHGSLHENGKYHADKGVTQNSPAGFIET